MLRIPLTLLFVCFLTFTPQRAAAQAAVNVASFANPNLPNGALAQGGMFTVFGSNLGPGALVQVGDFPLPTELSGTSVSVTVGGTTVDCIMIFTSAGQVAAILPSSTPVGEGTMTVTFNGSSTPPFAVTVVANSFGTFGINSAGSGPGVFTNATTFTVNTISTSAAPGELWDIWGTGLGAVPFADNDLPVVQNLGFNVQVFVGGQEAQVIYAGRSGCCAGVDQIRFVVPAGLSGCYIPVTIVVEGVPSNYTSISVAPNGGACSDPGGLTQQALADGDLTTGVISLTKTSLELNIPGLPGVAQSFNQVSEGAGASYFRYSQDLAVRQAFGNQLFNVGSCTVYQFNDEDGEFVDPIQPQGLDAGPQTMVSGPPGPRTLTRSSAGHYSALLSTSGSPFPFLSFVKEEGRRFIEAARNGGVEQTSTPYFTSGTYTYSAPGGADVGAHSQSIDIGTGLTWTNKDQVEAVQRASGQAITWTPFSGEVTIFGSSFERLDGERVAGAAYFCLANGSAGSFNIGPNVLRLLPASTVISEEGFTFETGFLSVAKSLRRDCEASGLDVCILSYSDSVNKQVGYR